MDADDHDAVTVVDGSTVDLTLTDQQLTAEAIGLKFGSTALTTAATAPSDGQWLKRSGTEIVGVAAPIATNHAHTGTTDGVKLAQAVTHESVDTDSATSALHHTLGTGANQAAAGNHTHAGYALNAGATQVGGDESNHVAIAADGTLTLVGTATAWDDYMIPGTAVKTTGNSPPDLLGNFAGSNTLDLYAFDGNNTLEQVFFTVQMPHRWKQGSTIYPHVHFSPTSTNTGDTNERVVRFSLEYTWININGTFGASATLHLDSDPFVPNTSQWKHLLAKNASGIAGTNKTLSSMLICRLYRDPTDNADTYPQDAAFLQFDIHYEIDAFGSSSEYTK